MCLSLSVSLVDILKESIVQTNELIKSYGCDYVIVSLTLTARGSTLDVRI